MAKKPNTPLYILYILSKAQKGTKTEQDINSDIMSESNLRKNLRSLELLGFIENIKDIRGERGGAPRNMWRISFSGLIRVMLWRLYPYLGFQSSYLDKPPKIELNKKFDLFPIQNAIASLIHEYKNKYSDISIVFRHWNYLTNEKKYLNFITNELIRHFHINYSYMYDLPNLKYDLIKMKEIKGIKRSKERRKSMSKELKWEESLENRLFSDVCLGLHRIMEYEHDKELVDYVLHWLENPEIEQYIHVRLMHPFSLLQIIMSRRTIG